MRELLRSGKSVRAFVRRSSDQAYLPSGADLAIGEITNFSEVRAAMKGCASVIHACSTHVYNLPPQTFWEINVGGTRNVCDAATQLGCARVVLTSTISTFAPASGSKITSPPAETPARKLMSIAKQAAEREVLERIQHGLPATIINPPYFIGPYDFSPSPFRLWAPLAVLMPIRLVPGGGFNMMSARDVARAHVWALDHGAVGTRYPLVGRNIDLVNYATMLNHAAGRDVVPHKIPRTLLRLIAAGKVFDKYVVNMITRPNYFSMKDSVPVERELLDMVISRTVRWYRDNKHLTTLRSLVNYVWSRYI